MLRVYFCRPEGEAPELAEGLLSSYRREKLAALKAPRARSESVFSELLLRRALADSGFPVEAPLDIAAGEHGKPFLPGGECFFSISHSAGAVLCAISDRETGADLQIVTRAKPPLMERFFAEEERKYVLSSEDADGAFTEIWTKKESWCKLSGFGLALPLSSFSVLDESIAPLMRHRRIGEYHLAVCGEAARDGEIEWTEIKTDALLG